MTGALASVAEWARRAPDKPALVDDTGAVLTFAELDRRATRWAGALARLGIEPGDVCLQIHRTALEPFALFHGIQKIGALSSVLSVALHGSAVAALAAETAPALVVADESGLGAASGLDGTQGIRRVLLGAEAPPRWLASDALLADARDVTYTSAARPVVGSLTYSTGTSGRPKAIFRSSGLDPEAVDRGIRALGFSEDDVHLMSGPPHHSAAWGFATLQQLLGATCVVMRSFHPRRVVELLEEREVTTAVMAPVHLKQLLDLPHDVLARRSLRRLRVLMVTGAPFPEAVKRRALEVFGDALHESYGSTETGMVTLATGRDLRRRPASVGRTMEGVELRILDEQGSPVATGERGLLWVRTPSLFERYWGDAHENRRSGDGFFTAADVGYVDDDGYVFVCDRLQDCINVGGTKIYPTNVETALTEHPAVEDAAVVGMPNERFGEEVLAVVKLRPGAAADAADLIAHCAGRVSPLEVPWSVEFADEIPRDTAGKLLRRVVREQRRAARAGTS